MDVRCERCNTEYEFDDALVSGRGTTVKCTSCGHKFKIRRKSGDFSEDFWNVRTGDGKTLVFTSLRELQRAIQSHLVARSDLLSRGGLPPKPIAQIPELAPFFDVGTRGAAEQPRKGISRPPPPPGAGQNVLPPMRMRQSTMPDFPPAPANLTPDIGKTTLIGTGAATDLAAKAVEEANARDSQRGLPAAPAMRKRMSSVPPPITEREPVEDVDPDTENFERQKPIGPSGTMPPPAHLTPSGAPIAQQRPTPPPVPSLPKPTPVLQLAASGQYPAHQGSAPPPLAVTAAMPVPTPPPPAPPSLPLPAPRVASARPTPTPPPRAEYEVSSPLPPPAANVRFNHEYDEVLSEPPARERLPSLPDAPQSMGKGRSVGGFVVVTVLLVSVALLAVVWGRENLGARLGFAKPPPAQAEDPRVSAFLSNGERALADGNVELAKESFDKASALAEKDPHVLLDEARLTAIRADVLWLKSRLLPSDAADEHRSVRDGLTELSGRARATADAALAVAPDDPGALRAKIDALRISGDRDGARALAPKISASAAQPETAYVLAALDLADAEQGSSLVLERLRVAAGAESGPGRGRAALVFALARSGDVAGAKQEIDRLEAMPRRHELLPLLKAFVERMRVQASSKDGGTSIAASALPNEKPEPGQKGRGPGDPRNLVAAAEAARGRGDLEKAQTLYAAALDRNPNDTEALSGLAAIAQARGDLAGAKASYKRVLSVNPSYVPALVGLADSEWASGDRGSAVRTYKEIVDRFPEGTYPPRVKQRAEGSAPAPQPTTTAAPTATTAPTATATSTSQKDEPGF
ncbi:MAG TPA: zinc-ribbon domain-containing protein [Labilithrix sp.]